MSRITSSISSFFSFPSFVQTLESQTYSFNMVLAHDHSISPRFSRQLKELEKKNLSACLQYDGVMLISSSWVEICRPICYISGNWCFGTGFEVIWLKFWFFYFLFSIFWPLFLDLKFSTVWTDVFSSSWSCWFPNLFY